MKIKGFLVVAAVSVLTGCSQNCTEKIADLYKANRSALENERQINKFNLRFSYVPSTVLHRNDTKDTLPAQKDTGYYYFKLQVTCPPENNPGSGNTAALYYGIDTLFATGEMQPYANPVLIEPVITGSKKAFEYLLVFEKEDFAGKKQATIVFHDRLFTNTKQVFVFDRKKIDEIETIALLCK
jgi:hypothetical protein